MKYNEFVKNARKNFGGKCKVCPKCNGVACAGQVPGMGGVRTAQSFKNNVQEWEKYGIMMTGIGEHCEVDTSFDFLGQKISMPIMVAPIGAINVNVSEVISEEEYCYDVCTGALNAGTIAFTGDSAVEGVFDAGVKQIALNPERIIPTIKPRLDEQLIEFGERAKKAGAKMLASDMDSATIIHMRMFGQPVERKTYEQWGSIIEKLDVPFIIKGVMDPIVACKLIKKGVKCIIVSNHGGRMLDGAIPTSRALEMINDYCIKENLRDQVKILVDGGIRTGEDVFKALALGADGVLIGRPMIIAAVGGKSEAVTKKLRNMQQELKDAMYMNGIEKLSQIRRNMIIKL